MEKPKKLRIDEIYSNADKLLRKAKEVSRKGNLPLRTRAILAIEHFTVRMIIRIRK